MRPENRYQWPEGRRLNGPIKQELQEKAAESRTIKFGEQVIRVADLPISRGPVPPRRFRRH